MMEKLNDVRFKPHIREEGTDFLFCIYCDTLSNRAHSILSIWWTSVNYSTSLIREHVFLNSLEHLCDKVTYNCVVSTYHFPNFLPIVLDNFFI